MNASYKKYKCLNCGNVQDQQTNHELNFISYCNDCSWKPSFCKHLAIPFNGKTYREFTIYNKETK